MGHVGKEAEGIVALAGEWKEKKNPSGDKGWAGDRWRRSEHVSLHKYVQGYRRLILFSYLHLKNKVEEEEVERNPATLFTSH